MASCRCKQLRLCRAYASDNLSRFCKTAGMNTLPIPDTAIEVADTGALIAALNSLRRGQQLDGQTIDLYLSGLDYEEFAVFDYWGATEADWLTLWMREDGRTTVRYTGEGMSDAAGAVVRLGTSISMPLRNIRFRNTLNVDGLSNDDGVGAIFGFAAGGSHNTDPRRADLFNVDIEGPRIKNLQQWGFKFDGNGGSRNLRLAHFEISHTGFRHDPGESDGFGEGLYIGDGATGRPVVGAVVEHGWLHDIHFGEGAEVKQNCKGVKLDSLLLERVFIDNGAAIKFTSRELGNVVSRCIVDTVTVDGDSDTGAPVGIQSYGGTDVIDNYVKNIPNGYCYDVIQAPSTGVPPVTFMGNYGDATGARGALRDHGSTFFGPHPVEWTNAGGNSFTGPRADADLWQEVEAQPRPSFPAPADPVVPVEPAPVGPTPVLPEGSMRVSVVAKGSTGFEQIQVIADGQARGIKRTLDIEWRTLTWSVPITADVQVWFDNDSSSSPDGDRNVHVERIFVSQDDQVLASVPATHPDVHSSGSWQEGLGCAPMFNRDRSADYRALGWLHCNGELDFTQPLSEELAIAMWPVPPVVPVPPIEPVPEPESPTIPEMIAAMLQPLSWRERVDIFAAVFDLITE